MFDSLAPLASPCEDTVLSSSPRQNTMLLAPPRKQSPDLPLDPQLPDLRIVRKPLVFCHRCSPKSKPDEDLGVASSLPPQTKMPSTPAHGERQPWSYEGRTWFGQRDSGVGEPQRMWVSERGARSWHLGAQHQYRVS